MIGAALGAFLCSACDRCSPTRFGDPAVGAVRGHRSAPALALILVLTRARGGLAGLFFLPRDPVVEGILDHDASPRGRARRAATTMVDGADARRGTAPSRDAARRASDAPVRAQRSLIEARGLTKRFGGRPAIDDVSFRVERRRGRRFPRPERRREDDDDAHPARHAARRTPATATLDAAGRLPARDRSPRTTRCPSRSYLAFIARMKGVALDDVDDAMARAGVADLAGRPVERLSKGQRQRVGMAQALLGSPRAYVLDEPTIGLDPKQIVDTRDVIRGLRDDAAVLVSTHLLAEAAEICDRVVVIVRGRVVAEERPGDGRRSRGAVPATRRRSRSSSDAAMFRKELKVLWASPLPYVLGAVFHATLGVLGWSQIASDAARLSSSRSSRSPACCSCSSRRSSRRGRSPTRSAPARSSCCSRSPCARAALVTGKYLAVVGHARRAPRADLAVRVAPRALRRSRPRTDPHGAARPVPARCCAGRRRRARFVADAQPAGRGDRRALRRPRPVVRAHGLRGARRRRVPRCVLDLRTAA